MNKYEIHVSHFYCMEYSEGEHTMDIEIDFREDYFLLNKSLITQWKKPYDTELILDEKSRDINKYISIFVNENCSEPYKSRNIKEKIEMVQLPDGVILDM